MMGVILTKDWLFIFGFCLILILMAQFTVIDNLFFFLDFDKRLDFYCWVLLNLPFLPKKHNIISIWVSPFDVGGDFYKKLDFHRWVLLNSNSCQQFGVSNKKSIDLFFSFWVAFVFLDVDCNNRNCFDYWVLQKYHNKWLDAFFSGLSCVVSVPFYTAFLPLLFWSGHAKLARQMTILMAFCDYVGNCLKDVVSAPRPSSPPVRIVTVTADEKENAMEYGLPSSHTLNTVCLSGYLFLYALSYTQTTDVSLRLMGFVIVCVFVGLIGLGRIYLGMHSLIDILAGLALGLAILALWLSVHEHIDTFIVLGENVTPFWTALSFLLLFAYPTPEFSTPSYEYHTAFDGVALGIVTGVYQNYHQFHHENVPRIFTQDLTFSTFMLRMIVGIPTILVVKFCSKALAKWCLPIVASTMGIQLKSTSYIPALSVTGVGKKSDDKTKQSNGYIQKLLFFSRQDSFDVDTGIRFVQYGGLAWSVVDLVPSLFSRLSL